jgi:hypothetical protein
MPIKKWAVEIANDQGNYYKRPDSHHINHIDAVACTKVILRLRVPDMMEEMVQNLLLIIPYK